MSKKDIFAPKVFKDLDSKGIEITPSDRKQINIFGKKIDGLCSNVDVGSVGNAGVGALTAATFGIAWEAAFKKGYNTELLPWIFSGIALVGGTVAVKIAKKYIKEKLVDGGLEENEKTASKISLLEDKLYIAKRYETGLDLALHYKQKALDEPGPALSSFSSPASDDSFVRTVMAHLKSKGIQLSPLEEDQISQLGRKWDKSGIVDVSQKADIRFFGFVIYKACNTKKLNPAVIPAIYAAIASQTSTDVSQMVATAVKKNYTLIRQKELLKKELLIDFHLDEAKTTTEEQILDPKLENLKDKRYGDPRLFGRTRKIKQIPTSISFLNLNLGSS